ncbi:hypothetical protein ACQEU5_06045 [Marinactinospora thermotolerans]|uniref:hypothetical protein n=1 Tax=Marinactinospora thermotolerans TaxID=531310 RepID=UPI00099A6444|nr:hypothetical protein [Marinactinospora thermotolerans]
MTAIGALCSLVLLGGCGGQEAAEQERDEAVPEAAEEPAPHQGHGRSGTARTPEDDAGQGAGEVFVYNTYQAEEGRADREPATLTASEHTTFQNLEWTSWDGASATAEGEILGTWCLPECQDDPYAATITLVEPEEVDGTLYYTGYTVESEELPEEMREKMEEADDSALMLPSAS